MARRESSIAQARALLRGAGIAVMHGAGPEIVFGALLRAIRGADDRLRPGLRDAARDMVAVCCGIERSTLERAARLLGQIAVAHRRTDGRRLVLRPCPHCGQQMGAVALRAHLPVCPERQFVFKGSV